MPSAQARGSAGDRLAWWREARFGMFIHWGLYAVPAGVWKGQEIAGIGEWIMNRARIPAAEYEQLARQFNPVKFDAAAWVRVAKEAGMRYIVITSKHHDGFAMYNSAASTYDIADATPFGRDPLQELAEACRAEGLRLCFYYSQAQDWHHPDAAGNNWDYPDEERKDFAHYLEEKAIPQVRELLTNYGPIGLIWFDTPRTITKEQSQALTDLVHELQPGCLVNSRVGHGAGDYESAGDNQIPVCVRTTPWETPATLNDTWGYKSYDHRWKEPRTLIRLLCDIVGKGGNYLLNVGPTAEGEIPGPSIERLQAVGQWVRRNGEAIYGAGPSPFPAEVEWGTITQKPGRLFLHVFDWPAGALVVRGLRSPVRGASLLADGTPLRFRQGSGTLSVDDLRIEVPAVAPDPDVSVIALDIDGEAQVDPRLLQRTGGTIELEACLAGRQAPLTWDSVGLLHHWTEPGARVEWDFAAVEPGTFEVELLTAPLRRSPGQGGQGGQSLRIAVSGQELTAALTGDERRPSARSPHQSFMVTRCGRVQLPIPRGYTLTLTAEAEGDAPEPGLRAMRLVPVAAGA